MVNVETATSEMTKILPRTFSIRSLLAIVALAGVCLACHRIGQGWNSQNYPAYDLYSLLHTRVHDGDSLRDVARHFQTAVKVDLSNDPSAQRVWSSRAWTIRPGDEIWHFANSPRNSVYLQFHEGAVVNHRSSDFADPTGLAILNHHPIPPILLRHLLPICIGVFVGGACLLVMTDRRKRTPAKQTS